MPLPPFHFPVELEQLRKRFSGEESVSLSAAVPTPDWEERLQQAEAEIACLRQELSATRQALAETNEQLQAVRKELGM